MDDTVIVDAIDVEEEVNENQSYKEKLLGGGQKQDVNAKGNKDKALPLLEQPIQGPHTTGPEVQFTDEELRSWSS